METALGKKESLILVGFGCAASHFGPTFGSGLSERMGTSRCVEQSGEASRRSVQDGIWGGWGVGIA